MHKESGSKFAELTMEPSAQMFRANVASMSYFGIRRAERFSVLCDVLSVVGRRGTLVGFLKYQVLLLNG